MNPLFRRSGFGPMVILAAMLLAFALAHAGAVAAEPVVVGSAETVFTWRTQRCDDQDIPDAPARAFRDERGTVHLFASHFVNRALSGPSLDTVAPDCRVAYVGARNDDPAAYDDRVWLAAFHTTDGRTVHALGHAEYHGHLRTGCAGRAYRDCWWNAVVQLTSVDGGASFHRTAAGGSVVAASSYPYDGQQGYPTGYFSPGNIVERDGWLYTFIFASANGAQHRGACLLRTDQIDDPARWLAWDGSDFRVRLDGAYTHPQEAAENHVCAPVPGIPSTLTSLVQQADGSFLGLFAASRPLVRGGVAVTGVYAITSPDLLHWSGPQLLLAVPMMFDFPCSASSVYAYPSLLDPGSPSPTFASIGAHANLYLTRFSVRNCRLGMERDLVRFRVQLRESGRAGGITGREP